MDRESTDKHGILKQAAGKLPPRQQRTQQQPQAQTPAQAVMQAKTHADHDQPHSWVGVRAHVGASRAASASSKASKGNKIVNKKDGTVCQEERALGEGVEVGECGDDEASRPGDKRKTGGGHSVLLQTLLSTLPYLCVAHMTCVCVCVRNSARCVCRCA